MRMSNRFQKLTRALRQCGPVVRRRAGAPQGVGRGSNELHAGHGGDMTPKRSGAGGPESKEA
jgi:hypothetical protein